jgi:polysaccharide export outer membrane protein
MRSVFILALFALFFQSCITRKGTVYVQSKNYPFTLNNSKPFELTIKNDNILNILVTCDNPQSASVFNLVTVNRNITSNINNTTTSNVTYLVDNDGNIEFPLVGKLKVAGLKKSEFEDLIKSKLAKYIENPVVFVRVLNFRFYVLGEVNRSGEQILNDGERVTLLEALTKAGDLTINGNRKKVKLIRESNGATTINQIDITNPDFINSDFYYLQQNDIVYVEPNKAKISTNAISPIATVFSFVTGALTLYLLIDRF